MFVFSTELRGRVSELERNLSNQEKEIRTQALKLQELQTQLSKAHKDLAERDRDVAKASQELNQATDRHQQLEAKVSLLLYVTVSSIHTANERQPNCPSGLLVFCSWAEDETSQWRAELPETQCWKLQANAGAETQGPREEQPEGQTW